MGLLFVQIFFLLFFSDDSEQKVNKVNLGNSKGGNCFFSPLGQGVLCQMQMVVQLVLIDNWSGDNRDWGRLDDQGGYIGALEGGGGGQHGRQVVNKLVSDNNKHITIIESMTGRCRFFLFFFFIFFSLQFCFAICRWSIYLVGRLYFIHRSDIISSGQLLLQYV